VTLAPGLHRNVPMDQYLALPYMSGSRLSLLRRSPLQMRHASTEPAKQSDALERGTALHLAVLEPDLFAGRYVVAEPCGAVLKSGKREGQVCNNPGLFRLREGLGWVCGQHVRGWGQQIDTDAEVLTAEVDEAVRAMADAIRTHRLARSLFEGRGEFEATIVFEDPETGVLCKVRPDRLVERAKMYVALKTSRDAAPWAFPRDAETRGYFLGFALYRRALRAIGWPYEYTAVCAIESAAPYDIACYLVDEADIDSADAEVSRLLRIYADCTKDDTWPGYCSDLMMTLRRPTWAKEHANV
jgi:exodeoxyribonuclease VIII